MKRFAAVAAVLGSLGACSGIDLSPVNPSGVSLTGVWQIDFAASDVVGDQRDRPPPKPKRNVRNPVVREVLKVATGSGLEFVAQDFQVLRADKLEIELNPDSMGIRYYPGVYRDVSWGERRRGLWEVYAGWEERQLVVDSKAKDLNVRERYVQTGPDTLVVRVAVSADGEESEYTRTFKRRS